MKDAPERSNQSFLWKLLTLGGLVGLVASFIQAAEVINHFKNPEIPLQCNINPIFNCSNVFDSWQSSVFGFSNSLMCIVFFSAIVFIGLTAVLGSKLNKNLRLVLQFFSLFFLGFGAWYLWQGIYNIGSLCIFCLICYSGVILINWAWGRINVEDLPFSAKAITKLKSLQSSGADTFLAIIWAIIIAATIIFKFY